MFEWSPVSGVVHIFLFIDFGNGACDLSKLVSFKVKTLRCVYINCKYKLHITGLYVLCPSLFLMCKSLV